ncbi:DUF1014 family protein [Rhizoctonia solani 123E]|uniref:DUF1014 family protein n=1 Tax=Rhizoctonia solani 123E TaxID=1423351 RepID=A0A074S7F5_9AGAM|nr:DUF1014 family protein [Rhizoctonia solani 123E]
MPPKGGNAKKEGGRAKKAENEAKKQEAAAATKEKKEADEWSKGSKSTKANDDKAAKKAAEAARKAENARLLAEEEASTAAAKKAAPKAGNKGKAKAPLPKPAGPGALAAGGGLSSVPDTPASPSKPEIDEPQLVESFAATGIDDALDLLDAVNAKTDKASVGQQAAGIEKHPERRFKAAFEAYQERELPVLKEERPGLRLQQYKDLLYKMFQKSPDNPFNQTLVSYDATKSEKVEALTKRKKELEERLRETD